METHTIEMPSMAFPQSRAISLTEKRTAQLTELMSHCDPEEMTRDDCEY